MCQQYINNSFILHAVQYCLLLQQGDRLFFKLMMGKWKELTLKWFSLIYPVTAMTCHSSSSYSQHPPPSPTYTHYSNTTRIYKYTRSEEPSFSTGFVTFIFQFLGYHIFPYGFLRISFSGREPTSYIDLTFNEASVVITPLKLFNS